MLNSGQINSCAVTKAVVGAAVNTVSAADSVGGTSALQTAAENAAGVAKAGIRTCSRV